jgi:hypothetical protein
MYEYSSSSAAPDINVGLVACIPPSIVSALLSVTLLLLIWVLVSGNRNTSRKLYRSLGVGECICKIVKRKKRNKLPPGPYQFPMLGNLVQMMAADARQRHRFFAHLAKRYGPIVFLRLGHSTPAIIVSNSAFARQVLYDSHLCWALISSFAF